MTRVKICGITSVGDAEHAAACGADAIGFIFAESPRRVAPEKAAEISKAVGPWVATVGVFVNEKAENILRIADQCRLSAVQLHGDESAELARRLSGRGVIKAFRIAAKKDLKGSESFPADLVLFDTKIKGVYGGTGKTFDWGLLKEARRPFIVSGGLDPRNVAEVVKSLSPYGVDVSSGVEKAPGKKDPKRVKEFIRNAKK